MKLIYKIIYCFILWSYHKYVGHKWAMCRKKILLSTAYLKMNLNEDIILCKSCVDSSCCHHVSAMSLTRAHSNRCMSWILESVTYKEDASCFHIVSMLDHWLSDCEFQPCLICPRTRSSSPIHSIFQWAWLNLTHHKSGPELTTCFHLYYHKCYGRKYVMYSQWPPRQAGFKTCHNILTLQCRTENHVKLQDVNCGFLNEINVINIK